MTNINDYEASESANNAQLNEPASAYAIAPAVTETSTVDEEMMHYWQELNLQQKQAMVDCLKAFAVEEAPLEISADEWAAMMKEREAFLAGTATTYTMTEASAILRNPETRNALLHRH